MEFDEIDSRKEPNKELIDHLLRDNARDYIFIIGMDGTIVYVNEQAAKDRGYTQDELIGLDIRKLDTPECAVMAFHRFEEARENGYTIHNVAHKCKNGSILISETITRIIKIKGAEYALGLLKNISGVHYRAVSYVTAQEKEREWISIEIHDRVIQNLTALLHNLDALGSRSNSSSEWVNEIHSLAGQLADTILETRNITKELYPSALARYGLIRLIKEELDRFKDETHCECELITRSNIVLPNYLSATIYRVFHEALLNIRKHAHATKITVKIKSLQIKIYLEITDNGIGFKVKNIDRSIPGGIESMRRRTEIVGGDFIIKSSSTGTTMKAVFPISMEL